MSETDIGSRFNACENQDYCLGLEAKIRSLRGVIEEGNRGIENQKVEIEDLRTSHKDLISAYTATVCYLNEYWSDHADGYDQETDAQIESAWAVINKAKTRNE